MLPRNVEGVAHIISNNRAIRVHLIPRSRKLVPTASRYYCCIKDKTHTVHLQVLKSRQVFDDPSAKRGNVVVVKPPVEQKESIADVICRDRSDGKLTKSTHDGILL